jgi:hypothetical protein
MTNEQNKRKLIKDSRYWLTLLNVAEPAALKQEVDKLIELRDMLGAMTQKSQ